MINKKLLFFWSCPTLLEPDRCRLKLIQPSVDPHKDSYCGFVYHQLLGASCFYDVGHTVAACQSASVATYRIRTAID